MSAQTLDAIDPNTLSYFDEDNNVRYEKVLETIFNQEMASRNSSFYSQIGVDVNKVVRFSNYLPYSIEQSEMDYLIIESEDMLCFSKIFLLELITAKYISKQIFQTIQYT